MNQRPDYKSKYSDLIENSEKKESHPLPKGSSEFIKRLANEIADIIVEEHINSTDIDIDVALEEIIEDKIHEESNFKTMQDLYDTLSKEYDQFEFRNIVDQIKTNIDVETWNILKKRGIRIDADYPFQPNKKYLQ